MLASLGSNLWDLLWFIVAVSILVAIHEFGHYWVARRLGFKVLRFSVGFGPALWRSKPDQDGTEFVLASVPLGGYVKLLDEREGPVPPEDRHRAFTQRPPWQRILVLLAGPGINILFAILVLWAVLAVAGRLEIRPLVGQVTAGTVAASSGLATGDNVLSVNGEPVSGQSAFMVALIEAMSDSGDVSLRVRTPSGAERDRVLRVPDPAQRLAFTKPDNLPNDLGFRFLSPPAVLGEVVPGGPAAAAGLAAGDELVQIDDMAIADDEHAFTAISGRPGETLRLQYRRGGELRNTELTTQRVTENGKEVGKIRVRFSGPNDSWRQQMSIATQYSLPQAFGAALDETWRMTALQASILWKMLTGRVSLSNLSGPITIGRVAGQSARFGFKSFLSLLVMISLSLGFLNLLPIPILDGGQILYQAAEWLKGSPLSERTQLLGQQIGIVLLVLLMGIAFFNDIVRQIQPG
jgi:regulator of sigma E protease